MSDILNIAKDNLNLYSVEGGEYIIDSDEKAEWALTIIREEQQAAEKYISTCDFMINSYMDKIKDENERLEKKTSNIKLLLEDYFAKVDTKKSKTQESYKLPSGTLQMKYQAPKVVRDSETLLAWLQKNDMNEFVKTEKSVSWDKLKKKLELLDNKYITADGEVVEGIKVEERDPVFKVNI